MRRCSSAWRCGCGWAIEAAIKREQRGGKSGGPYIAEQHISEAVALLRRWGCSQEQLDKVLAGSGTFTRSAADIEAVLAWLQGEFGLKPGGLALACSRSPTLLERKQETLQANWQTFQSAYQPTAAAITALATAVRTGQGHFLWLKPDTVKDKVGQLQQLFFVDGHSLPKRIGHMAALFSCDIPGTTQPRLAFLQALTGVPSHKLASRILPYATLLNTSEELLQRKRDALVAAMGERAAHTILCMRPDVLETVEERAALNLAALQQLFGVSQESTAGILCGNTRLLKLDMQSSATEAKLSARVAFWQQVYGLTADVAAVRCTVMLHQSLRTVAPRVAYYQQQLTEQPLPPCTGFARGDGTFCERFKLNPRAFAAFKARWLASAEGRAVSA